ncbi:PQQ-binding-like beta-propeller repeat protein [Nocardia sp. NPDC059228]|uniref:outer membrane protein assembly factor BamB family protein n=1 Tax=Nocardia sp. NPDC059228 TaxID=3346777 RepID=UPI0036D01FE8
MISRRKVLRDGAILAFAGVAAACAAPRRVAGTAASGSIAWEYQVDGEVRGLRYGAGTVVVENAAVLTGLEARSGRELWRFPIATPGIGRHSSVWSNALVVCGAEPDAAGDRAVAVDLASGKRNWSFDAPEGVVLGGVFGVRDGVLYLIASDRDKGGREAWAVDMTSKAVRWRVPCDAEALSVPDSGSLLYNQSPGTGNDLVALDLGTGATAWSRAGDSAVSASTIATGLVQGAVLATDGAHIVSGLDPKTGAALWTTPALPYTAGVVFGSGDAYYLCDGERLHAMTPGGEAAKLWSIAIADRGAAADVGGYPSAGAFYLLADRILRAIDVHTSAIRWTQSIPDKAGSQVSFAVGDAHCYVESTEDDPGASAVIAIVR